MTNWVEFHVPGASASRFELPSCPVFVGTGSESQLRVAPNTGFASRHFRLFPANDRIEVNLDESVKKGVYHAGTEYITIAVPWDSEIFVGNVRVVFCVEPDRVSPVARLALVVATCAIGLSAVGLSRLNSTTDAGAPPNDIEVLDVGRSVACTTSHPNAAIERAVETERAAFAKQQRFLFDPRDGVEALSLLREAEACYRSAQRTEDSSRAGASANQWLQILNTEYSTARLRLAFNLDHDRTAEALETIDELQGFTAANGQSAYGQWLARTRDSLLRRLAGTRK